MNIIVKQNQVILTPSLKKASVTTVGIQGPPGPESFSVKGPFTVGTQYRRRDLVSLNGNTYYALVDTSTQPSNLNPNWQLLSTGNVASMISTSDPAKSVQDRLNEISGKANTVTPVFQNNITVTKDGTSAATIIFPVTGTGNDPAYIQHVEATADLSEMRVSLGDNYFGDVTYADSFVIGSTPTGTFQPAYKFRDKLYFAHLGTGVMDNTNLYRYDNNVLKTDGGLVVAGNLTIPSINGIAFGTLLRSDQAITTTGTLAVGGYDITLGASNQVDRGNTGQSRAMVKAPGSILSINYAGDFGGGVAITGNTALTGNLAVSGTVTGTLVGSYVGVNNSGTGQYSSATMNWTLPGNKSTDRSFNVFLQKNDATVTSPGVMIFRQDKGSSLYYDFMQMDFSSGNMSLAPIFTPSANITALTSNTANISNLNATTSFSANTGTIGTLTSTTVNATNLAVSGNITTEVKLPNDSQGITFFGGGRIYKKAGYGLIIKGHDNNVPILFRDSTETFDTLSIAAYQNNYQGLLYQGKKVFNEGFMGAGSGLSADSFQGASISDFPRYSSATGGTFIGTGYYWNTGSIADAPMFNQAKFRFGIRVGELAANSNTDYIRLLPGYSNSPIINFTQNGSDLTVNHAQIGYGIGPNTGDLVIKNTTGRLIIDNTGAAAVNGNGMQIKAAKDMNFNIMDDTNGTIKMLRADLNNGVFIRPAQNSIDGIGGTLYLNSVGGSANNVAIGSTSNNTAKLHVTGTTTITDKVFVHASAVATPNVTSLISLAIGDNDTGFNWVSDGKVNFMANNTIVGYWTTAGVVTSSSRTLKENITPYTDSALELIDKIEVVNYNFKADLDKTPKVGFIAEDTDQLLTGHDHKGMDIGNTLGVLLKAVQELKDRMVYLEQGDDK